VADKADKGGKKSKSKKDHAAKDAARIAKEGAGKAAKHPDAEGSPRILPPDPVGTYADGTPFDRITYLEAKLILKPEFLTSGRSFRAFGRMVQETARLTGVGFIPDARTERPPESREILFADTPDFRLYKNAFILRRRIELANPRQHFSRQWRLGGHVEFVEVAPHMGPTERQPHRGVGDGQLGLVDLLRY
jgi:hypothetical protein